MLILGIACRLNKGVLSWLESYLIHLGKELLELHHVDLLLWFKLSSEWAHMIDGVEYLRGLALRTFMRLSTAPEI